MAPKSHITKAELEALTEAISKYAVGEERTAEALSTISAQLEKIVARIYNGMTKEFAEEVHNLCSGCKSLLSSEVANNKSILLTIDSKVDSIKLDTTANKSSLSAHGSVLDKIKDMVFWINIIFGSLSVLVGISVAVSQVIHWFSHIPKNP
jgi:Rad3-related DNA helicase